MSSTIIAACDRKMGIGKNNSIPWKSDLAFFKKMTTGHVIIMGRKTWNSLGSEPLKKRVNIIVSTQLPSGKHTIFGFDDNHQFYSTKSLTQAIELAKETYPDKEIFFIGGQHIYREALESNLADSVLLTRYALEADCDTFFPASIKELETKFKKWKTIDIDNEGEVPLMRTFYTNEL